MRKIKVTRMMSSHRGGEFFIVGLTDGTARFHVHMHQGSQILHSFSWRFRKYKFHVTVKRAVSSIQFYVEFMGIGDHNLEIILTFSEISLPVKGVVQ